MALDVITSSEMRDALRALRYATPLRGSPLLGLDMVAVRLRSEQLADTRQGRAWALGHCVEDAIDGQLRRMRGAQPGWAVELTAEAELDLLRQDLQSGSSERLDLALVHWRYLSPTHQPVRAVGRALGVTERTIRNRLARGVDLLTDLLRQDEVAATRSLEAAADASPVERIIVDEGAATRGVVELLGELQALVSQHKQTVRITPAQLEAVARYPVAELIAYRLGRIAEWSLPRYRLDSRFVELSMLVDLGEESQSGRWQAREERFTDLREVLGAVGEPAVVLLGPPGSGKSTLLRRLELDLSSDALGPGDLDVAAPLTFLVSLNQYRPSAVDASLPSPRDWLADRWAARFPKLPSLAEVASDRPVVYLLDGLNEMPHRSAEDYRARIALWKQFLLETVTPDSGHRAVIACRSLDYSAPLSTPAQRVPQVQVEPLSDAKVEEFLRCYSPQNADKLWAELAGTKVLDAVRWPFFLRLLVEDASDTEAMPRELATLFTAFVRRALVREVERDNPRFAPGALLSAWDYERVVSGRGWRTAHELPAGGALFPALAALAYGMQAGALAGESLQVRIGYAGALKLLPPGQAEEVVHAGVALGVIDVDQVANEVQFSHQLTQEYFAGRALAEAPDSARVRVPWRAAEITPGVRELIDMLGPADTLPALPTSGWEETTLMAAAIVEEPEPYLRAVMADNLVVAGRAANLPTVRPKVRAAFLDELRWALVARSRDPESDLRHRIACGYSVGDLGDPRFERRTGPHGTYLMPPLVTIPGGVYPIGGDEPIDNSPVSPATIHIPSHTVHVAGFAIGRFSVTNAEWASFVDSSGYEDERWWDTDAGRDWRRGIGTTADIHRDVRYWVETFQAKPELIQHFSQATWDDEIYARWQRRLAMTEAQLEAHLVELYPEQRFTEPRFWRNPWFDHPAQPVVGVCWHEARAYCAWLAAQSGAAFRLPTEVEWEAAARGRTGRKYAYGDAFDPVKANVQVSRVRRPTPVGVFVDGDTPEGVSDMSGNVTEWTSSLRGTNEDQPEFGYPYRADDGREDASAGPAVERIQRGGAWDDMVAIRAVVRPSSAPPRRLEDCGLRVAVTSA